METKTNKSKSETMPPTIVMTPDQLLEHWQGHRRVTRRAIEVFSEDKFFSYSIGGMRPFSELVMEIIGMVSPGIKGVVTGNWVSGDEAAHIFNMPAPATRKEVLALWDEATEQLNTLWPLIPPNRLQEVDRAFGLYEMPIYGIIFYWIDNEIHHRGQGYVYLRSLGIEPPAFYER